MPKKATPRIKAAKAGRKAMSLDVTWDNGERRTVDISGIISTFRVYEPLRQPGALFKSVKAGDYGLDVVWDGGIDMPADTLWRLTQEQSGQTMSRDQFRKWRERKAYSLDAAARALGLSRRMVAYYENGEKPIPRVVALATKALAAEVRQPPA